ncbi:acyltransferase family protein [Curtobacterium sp. MCPF17_052]|uniref:acyltransferase family protein n=1 Tax=Curtobacterium sp. MCPF17_052 TaxID=2175655 RepID=UPI0015E8E1B6|nr:acyltransferase family protein [Curtobacterium sp. MCPF17_052]WIB12407.1 acyltransferase family protein [Curtobacterium sp. MCPF17_052]
MSHAAPSGATDVTTGPRSVAVDALRVAGVIAIVAGHNWGGREWVNPLLYTWHVPIFFVVTGYLWKAGRTTTFEIKRRAETLLVPYVVWIVIVTAIWFAVRHAIGWPITHDLVSDVLKGGWYAARPYSAYWFFTALFFACVFVRLTERVHVLLPFFVGLLGVMWATVDPASVAHLWEGVGLAVPAVVFIVGGQMLRRYRGTVTRPLATGLVLAGPLFVLGACGVFEPLNMKGAALGSPVASVFMALGISLGGILIAEALEQYLPTVARKAVLFVAQLSVPILLLHTLVTQLLSVLGYPGTKWTFLVAYFVPFGIAAVLRATPLRRFTL